MKVTPDGKVKVLDFGLAKAWEGDPATGSSSDLSQSPTLAHTGTQAGVILGTAAYMSPEQARGKAVDKRADIWAFGVVLFEMLTGRSAVRGRDGLRHPGVGAQGRAGLVERSPMRARQRCAGCCVAAWRRLHGSGSATSPTRAWRSTRRSTNSSSPRQPPARMWVGVADGWAGRSLL